MTEKTQPTDAEIEQLYQEETGFSLKESPAALLDFARAVLAKWGTPAGAGEHRQGCPALGGYGHGVEECCCGATRQPTQAQAGAMPLTDEQCDAIYEALDAFGREVGHYEYGLPYCTSDGETLAKPEAREVIRQAAQNIKGADHG